MSTRDRLFSVCYTPGRRDTEGLFKLLVEVYMLLNPTMARIRYSCEAMYPVTDYAKLVLGESPYVKP